MAYPPRSQRLGTRVGGTDSGLAPSIRTRRRKIKIATDNPKRNVHQDHLGSTSVITDDTGAAIYEASYDPWGNVNTSTGTADTDRLYTGQRFDSATGLYYYNARYYDPTLARFISPDTIVPGGSDPQTWKRYAYVLGNPLRYVDPSGNCIEDNGTGGFGITDGDGDGISEIFDCSSEQFFALSWWLQTRYYYSVDNNEKWDDWKVIAVKSSVLQHGFVGQRILFGGNPRSDPQGCWATGKKSYSCPVPQPEPAPSPGCGLLPVCEIPGITLTVPDGTIPNGKAVTLFPFNIIEEGAAPCYQQHERVHNAQTVFYFGGSTAWFTASWTFMQLVFGDSRNPFENQAEGYSSCG